MCSVWAEQRHTVNVSSNVHNRCFIVVCVSWLLLGSRYTLFGDRLDTIFPAYGFGDVVLLTSFFPQVFLDHLIMLPVVVLATDDAQVVGLMYHRKATGQPRMCCKVTKKHWPPIPISPLFSLAEVRDGRGNGWNRCGCISFIIFSNSVFLFLRLNYKKKDGSNVNNAPVRLVFTTE